MRRRSLQRRKAILRKTMTRTVRVLRRPPKNYRSNGSFLQRLLLTEQHRAREKDVKAPASTTSQPDQWTTVHQENRDRLPTILTTVTRPIPMAPREATIRLITLAILRRLLTEKARHHLMYGQGIIRMILRCIILLTIIREESSTILVHPTLARPPVLMSDRLHHPLHPLHRKLRKKFRSQRKQRLNPQRHHPKCNPMLLLAQNRERKCQRRSSLSQTGKCLRAPQDWRPVRFVACH